MLIFRVLKLESKYKVFARLRLIFGEMCDSAVTKVLVDPNVRIRSESNNYSSRVSEHSGLHEYNEFQREATEIGID